MFCRVVGSSVWHMNSPVVEDRDVEETLDAVESLFAVRRSADAEMFVPAMHFADLHPTESVRAAREGRVVVRGRERAVRLGGEGTSSVAEFCPLELGAWIQMGSWSAKPYLADALDVRHRLPLIWRRVLAHEARVPLARLVAAKTRHLSREAVASAADALQSFGDHGPLDLPRVKAVLVLCNPTVAVELLAAFAAQRPGRPTSSCRSATTRRTARGESGRVRRRGSGPAEAPGPLEWMNAFARRVGFTPTHLPRWLTVRVLESDISAEPTTHASANITDSQPRFTFDWSRLLPSLTLNLHLAQEVLTREANGVVRWDGEGPVTRQFVHDHLRPLHSYVITPVIDLADQAPVDAYEIPTDTDGPCASGRRPAAHRSPHTSPTTDPGRWTSTTRRSTTRRYRPDRRSTGPHGWATTAPSAVHQPAQDPRTVDGAPTLQRGPALARPARAGLPRGPHRQPQSHPSREPSRHRDGIRPRHRLPTSRMNQGGVSGLDKLDPPQGSNTCSNSRYAPAHDPARRPARMAAGGPPAGSPRLGAHRGVLAAGHLPTGVSLLPGAAPP